MKSARVSGMTMLRGRGAVLALWLALAFGGAVVRTSAATLPAGFTETLIVPSLGGSPTAMAFAPDGRLFVCLQGGQLRVVKNGSLLPTPFVSLTVDSAGERGLLGIAFDPNFAANGFVYVYYTVPASGQTAAHNRVSRFVANGDVASAGSEAVVLDLNSLSSATNHNGGAIHFGPDGKLYIAVGENANGSNAQTLNNLLGKILRLNSDGSVPSDNPFYTTATGINRAIWTLGLRNPFTFAFQPGTSRMFINDVGQSTWEEIDEGIAGSNYGWPTTEGPTTDARFRAPIFYYGHGNTDTTGIAITGGAFYNPPTQQFPTSFNGKYFFADYGSGWIRVLDPANNTASLFATGISSPVDLHVAADGTLYYAARGSGGQIYRIQATPSQPMNISTRALVGTGDNAAIAGFIVSGTAPKNLLARALGPSLQQNGVTALADPILEIYAADGSLVARNDDWKDTQQQQIQNTQLAPTNDAESAVTGPLNPGSYTAVVRGKNNGTGVGLVEIYDLDSAAASRLANISTRALVGTNADVLIGGFILGANGKIGAAKVVIRGIGPSLANSGVPNPLSDPTLELYDANGALLIANDNWQDDPQQAAQVQASGVAPTNTAESAIATSLPPGAYTAIVAGKNGGTGVGLVELYNVP